jgi:rubrerythrin
MVFENLRDVLHFAIRKEQDARDLYLMFREMVKDPGAKILLQELADQELGHRNMLEKALEEGKVEGIVGKKPVKDLHLSDVFVAEPLGPQSSPQEVMIFAMKNESASYNLYRTMADNYSGTPLEPTFSQLAQEELHHKETLERQYEEHFMKWM